MRSSVWKKPILFFCILSIASFATSSAVKKYVEIPEDFKFSENGTNYIISSFSPKNFIKSDEFQLNATQCVQFSFKLMERRVRLHAFTCHMSVGGFCTLDKFSFPTDREGCTYLRPWTHNVDTWSFYFRLEKRPRKYGKAYESRGKKVRRDSSSKKSMSTDPIGILNLIGVVPCSEACGRNEKDKSNRIGSQSDGTFHRGRGNRLAI